MESFRSENVQDLQDRLNKVIGNPVIAALFPNCGIDRVLVGVIGSTVLVKVNEAVLFWDPIKDQIEAIEASGSFPFVGEFKLNSDSSEFWNSPAVQFALSVLS